MRRLIPALALVAALASAAPALAADRIVPTDAAGPLEAYRGKPWFEPLLVCAAVYVVEARNAPDAVTAAPAKRRSAEFYAAVATRVSEDRGMTFDQGLEWGRGALNTRIMAVEYQWPSADQRAPVEKGCDGIMAAYEKTFG
jgi:hypothetical protein